MEGKTEARQYQNNEGSYVLPNDPQEHERLDAQSEALIALMHGKPFHAPVKEPKRIIDIGCGTGTMTALLARKFPDAEVIGVDISPVPERHQQPYNLTYIQGNVKDLAGGDDPRFALGSFDYVFHRLLVLGMTDWRGYVKVVGDLLRPGGWAEMQDYDLNIKDVNGKSLSDEWRYFSLFTEDCQAIGLDTRIGMRLSSYMKDYGLHEVDEKIYEVPVKPTPDKPDAELIAKFYEKSLSTMNQALIQRVSGPRRSAEMVEKIRAEIKEEMTQMKLSDYWTLFVVCGQKQS